MKFVTGKQRHQIAINEYQIPSIVLMEHAVMAFFLISPRKTYVQSMFYCDVWV